MKGKNLTIISDAENAFDKIQHFCDKNLTYWVEMEHIST